MKSNNTFRTATAPTLRRVRFLWRRAKVLSLLPGSLRRTLTDSRCGLCVETAKYIENLYYHRSYAIKCGYLSDITHTARDAGFDCPVAITRDAYRRFVLDPGSGTPEAHFEKLDELLSAVLKARHETPEANILLVPYWGRTTTGGYMASKVRVVFAHDDWGNNCITIELPTPHELSEFADASSPVDSVTGKEV